MVEGLNEDLELTIANEIKDGALSEADAIAEARQLITQATAEGATAAAEVAEANGEY